MAHLALIKGLNRLVPIKAQVAPFRIDTDDQFDLPFSKPTFDLGLTSNRLKHGGVALVVDKFVYFVAASE